MQSRVNINTASERGGILERREWGATREGDKWGRDEDRSIKSMKTQTTQFFSMSQCLHVFQISPFRSRYFVHNAEKTHTFDKKYI